MRIEPKSTETLTAVGFIAEVATVIDSIADGRPGNALPVVTLELVGTQTVTPWTRHKEVNDIYRAREPGNPRKVNC